MRIILSFLFLLAILSSCSNVNDYEIVDEEPQIRSSLDEVIVNRVHQKIYEVFGPNTRAGAIDFTEKDAQELMRPFTEDGLRIKNQLITCIKENPSLYTSHDMAVVENATEVELAAISYLVYEVSPFADPTLFENPTGYEVSMKQIVKCLGKSAFGIDSIKEIRNIHNLTATTVLRTLYRVGKRQIKGYVGLVIAISTFTDCMGWTDIQIEQQLEDSFDNVWDTFFSQTFFDEVERLALLKA